MTQTPTTRSAMARAFWLVALGLALAKMKPPLDWTQTQFVLSYDLGITRRGLIGQVLQGLFPGGLSNAQTHWIAVCITATGLVALVIYLLRRLPQTQLGMVLGLLILTSLPVVNLIGNTGYLDTLWLASALAAVMIPGQGPLSLALKTALCLLGVLIHEAMLSAFVPFVALQIYLAGGGLMRAAVPVVCSVVLAAFLFLTASFADEAMVELIVATSARALDWDIRVVTLEAVMRFRGDDLPSFQNRWSLAPYLFERNYVLPVGLGYLAAVLMMVLKLIPHRSVKDRAVIVGVALTPLAVLFVAFDLPRFLALVLLQAWLILTMLLHHDATARARLYDVFTLPVIAAFFCAHVFLALPTLNKVPSFYDRLPGALLDVGEWQD